MTDLPTPDRRSVAGLLLAAGAGRRMGGPKGLLRYDDGTPWVAAGVHNLWSGGCWPVLVVVGAQGDEVAALVPEGATVVRAADWAQGMSASLRAGLAALSSNVPEAVAVLVGLVDTPGVSPDVVARLVAVAAPGALARAGYAGVAGHPVVLGRDHWAGVIAGATGDAGARGYLTGRAVAVVECGDVGDGRDVDEPGLR